MVKEMGEDQEDMVSQILREEMKNSCLLYNT